VFWFLQQILEFVIYTEMGVAIQHDSSEQSKGGASHRPASAEDAHNNLTVPGNVVRASQKCHSTLCTGLRFTFFVKCAD
jgi:hypothetical protein